jgi:hypothetical protein
MCKFDRHPATRAGACGAFRQLSFHGLYLFGDEFQSVSMLLLQAHRRGGPTRGFNFAIACTTHVLTALAGQQINMWK